jgi:competence protein ComEA
MRRASLLPTRFKVLGLLLLASASATPQAMPAPVAYRPRHQVPQPPSVSPNHALSAGQSRAAWDPEKLDINTATADQLKALPGMGKAYAERIIRGRPYRAKNQLTQRGILPDETYARIKDRIIARQPNR